jgi:8-oxo-dGTP diphosphatase
MKIDKIAYIKIEQGHILSTRSFGKTKFYFPGGKREGYETDPKTLLREVKEELDIDIVPKTIQYIGTFEAQADSHKEGVIVQMTCYTGEFEGTIKTCNEIAEVRWLSYTDIEIVSEVDKKIFNFLKPYIQGEDTSLKFNPK